MAQGKSLPVKETFMGIKIRYSDFFNQFVVLYPEKRHRGEVMSSMHRFDTVDDAKNYITSRQEEMPLMWWMD